MKKISIPMSQLTAVHEAAHVVLAVAFGLQIGDVTVIPDRKRKSHGSATVWDPLLGWQRGDGSRRVFVDHFAEALYAGRLAEAHFYGVDARGWTSDDTAAARSLWNWPPPGAAWASGHDFYSSYEALLKTRAARHVAAYAPHIEAFAKVLTKRKVVPGAEAFAIITALLKSAQSGTIAT